MGQIILVGDYSQDNILGIRNISCRVASGLFTTFQFPQGTYYQVPPTAKFYICQVKFQADVLGADILFGYGDDTVLNSAVPPTNPVYLLPELIVERASPLLEYTFFTEVPYNKYIFLGAVGNSVMSIIEGVEL